MVLFNTVEEQGFDPVIQGQHAKVSDAITRGTPK
jgi:hypothetical protein